MPFSLKKLIGSIADIKQNTEFAYVAVSNLVSSVLGGILWLILAYILSTSDYGDVNYSLSVIAIIGTIATFGLSTTLMTFLPKGAEVLRAQGFVLSLIAIAILAFPVFMIIDNLSAIVFLVGFVLYTLSVADALGSREFKSYAILMIGQKILQMGLALGLYFPLGVEGIILGYGIAYILFSYRVLKRLKFYDLRFDEIKAKYRFLIHSLSFEIARTITVNSDKLIIAPLYGFAILGMYQIGIQFLMLLGMIPTILYSYLLPQESAGVKSGVLRKAALILSGVLSLAIIVISPYMVPLIFPHYTDSIRVIQILGTAIIPLTISITIQSSMLASQRSKPVFIGALLYVVIQVTLMTLLGRMFGIEGLAISTVIAISSEASWLAISRRIKA